MDQAIKLIWDFKGQDALKIAQHHEIHLKEYINKNNLNISTTGTTTINQWHAIAFMVVKQSNMIAIRDILKPHRATLYNS